MYEQESARHIRHVWQGSHSTAQHLHALLGVDDVDDVIQEVVRNADPR